MEPTEEKNIQEEGQEHQEEDAMAEEEDEGLFETNWNETVSEFQELNLKKDLLRGIFGYGFIRPSKIQQKGILPIIQRRDVIGQAQSGSGKTATFTIGCLQNIDTTDLKI